ncbi:MAG: diaminopimelate epimerase, partial [Bacteroidales bacterium]|jgi:diaminopimelate epimerase|nr:diaminopimelate epimerase [Bacteroidales bacterium]
VNLPVETAVNQDVDFSFAQYAITCVSMGNPHCVLFVDDVAHFPLEEIGPKIETHPLFPEKTNVEFVETVSDTHVKMRVWERGSGETQACGTGACATVVAGIMNGKMKSKVTVSLLGGDLEIEWNPTDKHVYMTGEAVTVFEGKLKLPAI